ncbi:hypothetical protein P9X10_00900 [Bacillus cereus]|nr:hypothetical protein [Bacillus cereus]
MENKSDKESKLQERKKRKWFACDMDDGIIGSANTLKELLDKLGRRSANYVHEGHYEFKEGTDHYAWSVWIYKGKDLLKRNGFDLDDDRNTWHIDDRMDEYMKGE